jgi:hypothetical protein
LYQGRTKISGQEQSQKNHRQGQTSRKGKQVIQAQVVFKVLIGLFIVTPLATPLLLPMLPLFGAVMPVFTALEIALLLAIVIIGICLMLEICKGYESPR